MKQFTKEETQKYISLYLEGYSLASVRRMTDFSITEAQLRKMLKENRIPIRQRAYVGKGVQGSGKWKKLQDV
jgi:hypothetical protein